ncbi:hypothetical protein DI09_74p70 [Mitosporidium daphniae]|uniref:Uncharacterized protein n=1 Tax=Mitosporidium daphniae TaxID=1485682 RepID=A0A098VN76_9MICR|nr:uncharacterized protein DI09_74p70 [Mitosporidium daphniae]KGG50365.1 hypothetical protein DI09_74p70 [Mitosporidium daphniae]|eukprot:XP_013236806.1 uncharacterized protein DI09_74p70 [Mitosporidium daphniae]
MAFSQPAKGRCFVVLFRRISNSKISQHLLDLQEKNMLKLTIDSFSVPDVPKKDTVFHYICALRGEHVFKCFPGTLESKKYAFTIDPVKEYFVSGSFNLVLYSSFISMQDGKSHISNQFQTDLGRLDISRKADQATINADRLSMLGPNAWRDSCGPLPEVVSSGEPKSPPKASTLLSFVFVFLVIVVPWVSLLYLSSIGYGWISSPP